MIFMHGIFASGIEAHTIFKWIEEAHPGTETLSIDKYEDVESIDNMNTQVSSIKDIMGEFMEKHPEGIHIICYSQGGLVCRGVLEQIKHNVDTFVSLSSPQSGQYGDTVYTRYLFPNFIRKNLYKILYTPEGQDVSVGNYWNEFKTNFLRLKKLVMIGGPDDGVITPWQSSHFAFYDSDLNVVEMRKQQWYLDDSFGLKTLDARSGLVTYVVPGVHHTHWHVNFTVFKNYILPYLT